MNARLCIVGAGPTGLLLGCLAQLNGIQSIIIEKNDYRDHRPKAIMIHARQLELFDRIGIVEEFLKKGLIQKEIKFQRNDGMNWSIDFRQLDSLFPFYLNITQPDIEDILEKLYKSLNGILHYSLSYVNHFDDGHSVQINCKRNGITPVNFDCDFLIGCDGGGSRVRKNLDVIFEGNTFQTPYLLGEGKPDTENSHSATSSMLITPNGVVSWLPFPDGRIRIAGPGLKVPSEGDYELSEDVFQSLQAALLPDGWPRIVQTDRRAYYRVHSRIANKWGHSRVWLAGDAAHLNPPAGGQALNLGFGDAESFVESIKESQKGCLSTALLRYESERKSVAQSTLQLVDMMPLVQRMALADGNSIEEIKKDLDKLAPKLSHLYIDYSAKGLDILGSDDMGIRSTLSVGRRYPWWSHSGNLNAITHRAILLTQPTILKPDQNIDVTISPDGVVRNISIGSPEVI